MQKCGSCLNSPGVVRVAFVQEDGVGMMATSEKTIYSFAAGAGGLSAGDGCLCSHYLLERLPAVDLKP